MAKTKDIKIKIKADNKQAVTGIGKVTGSLKKMVPSFNSVKYAAAATAVAIAAAGAAYLKMAKDTATAGDAMQKMSARLGVSAQALSELKHAAELSGSGIEAVEKGILKLSKFAVDADRGLSTAVMAFDDLGVSVRFSNGELKDAESLFTEVIGKLGGLESNTQQLALAQELLGKSGTKLIPLIKSGADGIAEMRAEAVRLGITFSDFEAQHSADFMDSITRLEGAFKGLRKAATVDALPGLTDFFNKLTVYISNNRAEIVAFGKDFVYSLASIAETVAISGVSILDFFERIGAASRGSQIASVRNELLALEDRMKRLTVIEGENSEGARILNAEYQMLRKELVLLETAQAKWAADPGMAAKLRGIADALRNMEIDPAEVPTLLEKIVGTGEGQTAATTEKALAAQASLMAALQSQRDDLYLTDEEKLDAWWEEKFLKVAGNYEGMLLLYEIYIKKKQKLDEAAKNKDTAEMTASVKWAAMTTNQKLGVVSQGFGNMAAIADTFYRLSDGQNKAAFIAFKAFSIAQAVIDTYRAATGAYAALAWIPGVGPALGAIAAAAAIAAGFSRVQAIIAMQPGSSASATGGGGGGGAPPISTVGGGLTTTDTTRPDEDRDSGTRVIVNVQGHVVDNASFARDLAEYIKEAKEDKNDFG